MRIALILLAYIATDAYASDFESRYFASALSGDLSWVIDTEPETPAELALKARFDERFLNGSEISSLPELDDPLVRAIARRFHDYWRQALLEPQKIEVAERHLYADIADLISLTGFDGDPADIDSALAPLLAQRGFNYSSGRTTPLIDFVLWRESSTVEFDVELTDIRQNVVVHFLNDIVVRGWSDFATFGHAGTGGWADRNALYCVATAYDVESENFKNSYLRHEARHFADFERYPALKATDLEYRGKLTELAFSTDAERLLVWFWRNSDGESIAPHPLANWHIVHDMAGAVDASCREEALRCIESVSNGTLRVAARRLLVDHTKKLETFDAVTEMSTFSTPEP